MSASERDSIMDVIRQTQVTMTARRAQDLQKQVTTPRATPASTPGSIEVPPGEAFIETAAAPSAVTAARPAMVGSQIHVPIQRSATYISASDRPDEFATVWSRKIQMFVDDSTRSKLILPAELSAYDRRELHSLAEKFNLSHHSEGVGRERHMVISKDELHFRAPTMRPDVVASSLDSAAAGGGDRRQAKGEKKLVADKSAIKAFNSLMRSTDQYSHATESAFTMDDLAATAGTRNLAPSAGGSSHHDASELWSRAMQQSFASNAGGSGALSASEAHDENMTANANAKRKRDADPADDTEDTYRAGDVAAATDEQRADLLQQSRRRLEELSTGAGAAAKMTEDGAAAGPAPEAPLETLTLHDAVSIARVNDMCEADVAWIESFAARLHPGKTLERVLQFAIDFEEAHLGSNPHEVVALVKEAQTGDAKATVGELLTKLFAALGSAELEQQVVVVLPGISMYGAEGVAAVAFGSSSVEAVEGVKAAWSGVSAPPGCVTVGDRTLLKGAI